jgi:hypothetical protein
MSTQSQSTQFVLTVSGSAAKVLNNVYQSSGNITVNYTIAGAPATMSIVVEGIAGPKTGQGNDYGAQAGAATVIDTYSSTSSVSNRSVALNGVQYDSFNVIASWTGGKGVTINGSLQMTGSGPTWSSSTLGSIQTYTGA